MLIERRRGRWGGRRTAVPGRTERPARTRACLNCSPGSPTGGGWEAAAPSAALAAALEAAAGPDGLYPGADIDALTGIAARWAAIESWAAAGLLASLRAMMREDGEGRPLLLETAVLQRRAARGPRSAGSQAANLTGALLAAEVDPAGSGPGAS